MTPEHVRQIVDPLARARAAQGFLERADDALSAVRGIRDDAIRDLLDGGASLAAVAADVGLSKSLIHQIAQRGRSTATGD